ncbi:MAG: ATP-dependent DNA helicase RecQ, partial [Fimbriimonas ginsengisoli]|nr:ATP-dependent DNA helicase RecQ [Fimbriimonas ginsengisoli]
MEAHLRRLTLLRQALDDSKAEFRPGQEDAVQAVFTPPFRAVVVQATGWGKSMVYFLATRMLRDQGKGPTLVISPLLSLMRDQLRAASRLGLKAAHYTSGNEEDWPAVEADLKKGVTDLLLISPERLASDSFRDLIASSSLAKVGLVVIDEAHCISDWGHDFRPDYQRLGAMIRKLPPTTSVLATTATANSRVVEDIQAQIGPATKTLRGSLARKSLRLQVVAGLDVAERLAWLSDHLDDLPGSGIIYTLTIRDAERVARWLQSRGHAVLAYHARLGETRGGDEERVEREDLLLKNDVKALVSTVALG